MEKKVAPHWDATARPMSVFPVPGGPNNSKPTDTHLHTVRYMLRGPTTRLSWRLPFGRARKPVNRSGRFMGHTTSSITAFFANPSPAVATTHEHTLEPGVHAAVCSRMDSPMSSNVMGVPLSMISFSISSISFGSMPRSSSGTSSSSIPPLASPLPLPPPPWPRCDGRDEPPVRCRVLGSDPLADGGTNFRFRPPLRAPPIPVPPEIRAPQYTCLVSNKCRCVRLGVVEGHSPR